MHKMLGAIIILALFFVFLTKSNFSTSPIVNNAKQTTATSEIHPLMISEMRKKSYPGSDIMIEQILPDGNNYHQYIASYKSDGFKIYGLLTVPATEKPKEGFPAIIFNHGYLPPKEYRTTERYVAYVDSFARNGYVVFKPDFRGHGNSGGQPEGAYYSPAYTTDALNAVSSIKTLEDPSTHDVRSERFVDTNRIGMWGHSMGGNITLRDIVVNTKDIKAAVIWGGVVGSYEDLRSWRDPKYRPGPYELSLRYRFRTDIEKKFGSPQSNPDFWHSIDPTYFLNDVQTPIQLHAGTDDEEVPSSFSESLYNKLKSEGKTVEFYTYEGSDHNISQGFNLSMQRSVAFFDKYLK